MCDATMNTFEKLKREGFALSKIKRFADRKQRASREANDLYRVAEDCYGLDLQRWLKREAQKIVEKHSQSWHVRARVTPMVDHRDYSVQPFVALDWADHGGRFSFEAVVSDRPALDRLLHRFRETVKLNAKKDKP